MLQCDLEKVCFIVAKAREFDVPEGPVEEDPASNATDDGFQSVLADNPDHPARAELIAFIENLNDDEKAELVALMWLGRGDYAVEDWGEAVREARARRQNPTSNYLLGTPILADLIEEGLAQFGMSCTDEDVVQVQHAPAPDQRRS
jgi:hypothetical protein